MIQIKKTILSLVALIAVTTGAWAQGYYDININFDHVYNPEFTFFMCNVMGPDMPSGTLNLSVDGVSKGSFDVDNGMCSGEISPALDAGDHTWYAEFIPEGGGEKSTESRSFTIDQDFAYVYIDDPGQSSIEMGVGESRNFWGHVDGPESSEVNISSSNDNVAKFRASSSSSHIFEGYIDAVGAGTATITVSFAGNKNYKAAQSKTLTVTVLAPSAASGPEVAWNKAENTGSFTMPGGNVTLEPEYYPQATLAFQGLTAAEDAAAKTEAPLAVVADGAVTGGTLMYYVATDKNFSQADAIALAETQWSADIPTAETIEAAGTYIMWYYIKGDAEHSDTDPIPLVVTLLPAPTYAVTFADDLAEPTLWTASPAANVTKGQTVTVTYTGTKKVLGVKAEKKSAAPAKPLANATAEDLGKIAGADGNIYDTKAAAEAANTTAVAMIAYVGSASDCTHGLAIALADESGTKTWSEAGAACSGKTAVTGGTWRLPSIKDWQYMFIGCGASGSYSDSPSTMSYSELATKLTTANGTALQTVSYWSSTESSPGEDAWSLYFGGSSASFFSGDYEGDAHPIRACLVF